MYLLENLKRYSGVGLELFIRSTFRPPATSKEQEIPYFGFSRGLYLLNCVGDWNSWFKGSDRTESRDKHVLAGKGLLNDFEANGK